MTTNATRQEIIQQSVKLVECRGYLKATSYLEAVYQTAKKIVKQSFKKNTSYNYLSFAEDLKFGRNNALWLIIRNKRPLTLRTAKKIANSLRLPVVDKEYFLSLVELGSSKNFHEQEAAFEQLLASKKKSNKEKQQLHEYFSQWLNPVIKEIIYITRRPLSAKDIQDLLHAKVNLSKVKKSLQLLTDLGYVQEKDSLYSPADNGLVATGYEADQLSVSSYHRQMLQLAQYCMNQAPAHQRDIQSLTIGIPQTLVPKLKERIHEWVHEALAYERVSEHKEVVYQLNFQLFPVSKNTNKRNKAPKKNNLKKAIKK